MKLFRTIKVKICLLKGLRQNLAATSVFGPIKDASKHFLFVLSKMLVPTSASYLLLLFKKSNYCIAETWKKLHIGLFGQPPVH